MRQDWIDTQNLLDDKTLEVGAVLSPPKYADGAFQGEDMLVIGNGSKDRPMLVSVGVDRFNRLWKQDQNGLTMIADFGGAFGPQE